MKAAAAAVQARHTTAEAAPAQVNVVLSAPASLASAFHALDAHLVNIDASMASAQTDMAPVIQDFVAKLAPGQQDAARSTAAAAVTHVLEKFMSAHLAPLRKWTSLAQDPASAAQGTPVAAGSTTTPAAVSDGDSPMTGGTANAPRCPTRRWEAGSGDTGERPPKTLVLEAPAAPVEPGAPELRTTADGDVVRGT